MNFGCYAFDQLPVIESQYDVTTIMQILDQLSMMETAATMLTGQYSANFKNRDMKNN